jgi:hypothetical protein
VHCPILEQTADGKCVGRCWYYLHDNICPRHGDVSAAVENYQQGKGLTLERDHKPLRKARTTVRRQPHDGYHGEERDPLRPSTFQE